MNSHRSVCREIMSACGAFLLGVVTMFSLTRAFGVPLLIPVSYMIALLAFERPSSVPRYRLVQSAFVGAAIAGGILWSSMASTGAPGALLIACGLSLIALARVQRPQLSSRDEGTAQPPP